MSKLEKILEIVNKWEETGKLFFNRNSDNSMSIRLRDPQLWGGDPNLEHWANANEILEEIHKVTKYTSDIRIDKQAGQLVIEVWDIYK